MDLLLELKILNKKAVMDGKPIIAFFIKMSVINLYFY